MFDRAAAYAAAEACDFLSIGGLLKARPVEDGGRRLLYIEASNESRDYQGEVVLTRALEESAAYYLKFGNLDLDHVTVTGPRRGPANYAMYEIGRPIDVQTGRGRTLVKAELFSGDSPVAANANLVWDSITAIDPPQRWYPSVGGSVLDRSTQTGPDGQKRVVVNRVRWTNIGLSKTPVNMTVPTVSTVPFGVLAKAWDAEGLDLMKALEMTSGASTDVAQLSGGAALGRQSLDTTPQSYWGYREAMSRAIRTKSVAPNHRAMTAHATHAFGMDPDTAAEWSETMLSHMARDRPKPKEQRK